MSKFGAEANGFTIEKTRYGVCHTIPVGNQGAKAHCKRNAATCKFCHEYGVPQADPDPFDAACALLRANWSKRWAESDRRPGDLKADEYWPADGIHIVALDDETRARTILVSFGENDTAMGAISAICAVHNEMIGRPD
jgi:cytochrome c5